MRSAEKKKEAPIKLYILFGFLGLVLAYAILSNGILLRPITPIITPTATPILLVASKIPQSLTEVEQHRAAYGIDLSVFSNLPKPPADFYARKEQFEFKGLEFDKLSEKYWEQPEFYPGFETAGVERIKNFPPNSVIRCCYGAYPGEGLIKVPQNESGEISVSFIMHATWGASTYQAFSLKTAFPNSGRTRRLSFSDGSSLVEQDTKKIKEAIISISITPNETVIEPSYSLWKISGLGDEIKFEPQPPKFELGWVKKIKAKFKLKGLDAGKYLIGINVEPPSKKFNQEMLWLYSNKYEPGGFIGVGQPDYSLFIEVT